MHQHANGYGKALYRITKGRGGYDLTQDATDPPPAIFMKRMVNHRVPGKRGEQRMGIMEWWTHAGVPLRKAACNGSSMKCGIRYIMRTDLGRAYFPDRSIELLTFIRVTAHTQAHHHTETQQRSGLLQELRLTGLPKHRQWGK